MKNIPLALALSILTPAAVLAQDSPAPSQDSFAVERLGDDGASERPQRRQNASTQRALIPLGLLYASYDGNHDYTITRAELEAGTAQSFDAADRDGSIHLSLVELDSWRELVLGSRDLLPGNTQFDRNIDSRVETAEFTSLLSDLFESFDRNKNGQLEYAEMTRPLRQVRRERAERPERNSQRPNRGQRPPR